MYKYIKVKQQDITDCGAASLASVCAFYGLRFPVARIRQYAYTDSRGTNVLGIVKAAQMLGFTAKGVRASLEALNTIPLPAIAHLKLHNGILHFVVIYKINRGHVKYMDPADGGIHKKPIDEFKLMWTGVLVILRPNESFREGKMVKGNFSQCLNLLSPYKGGMFQALFGALICSILGLSSSIYIGKITDYVLVDGNMNLLNMMTVIMLVTLILQVFVSAMKSVIALRIGQRIDAVLILGYYKHILGLPQQFFDTMRVGEIISRVNDAVKIRTFINDVFIDFSVNLIVLTVTISAMLFVSWQLTVILLLSAPLFAITYLVYNHLNKKYLRRMMEKGADLESHFVESLNAIVTVKRYGLEDFFNVKTENRFVRLIRESYKSAFGSIMVNNFMTFISTGITVLMLWTGSTFVIESEITPGTLMMFYSLTAYVLPPLQSLITSNQQLQEANIAADRLFQIMDMEQEQYGKGEIQLTRDMIGDVVFEDVSFSYGSRRNVFDGLFTKFRKGKTTAIVGESGSGKTTLMSLLQNIYPVNKGHIRIGTYDITHITNESLRKLIGVVPQQIELFRGTVLENIAIGDFCPDMKKVSDLIDKLGLSDFIQDLPEGLNTYIGEHGMSLSGGERQRIAIARALYKDPEIIIFDEATSSLDALSERFVKQTITDFSRRKKTIIIIAHRLSTVMNADHIVVLDHGKITEEGSHQVLMELKGLYYNLWKKSTWAIDYTAQGTDSTGV